MFPEARLILKKVPLWTLLLCGIATAVYFLPSLQDATIYDRELIYAGEWWRLVTGNLVHLSAMHLAFDVTALFVVGTIIELQGDRHLGWLYFTAGVAIGLTVFVAMPELKFYGGLSGIVTATLVYLCLSGLSEKGGWRRLCGAVLALVVVKIGIEFVARESLLAQLETQPFVPVPWSHLAGACTALLNFMLIRRKHGILTLLGLSEHADKNDCSRDTP